MALDLWNQRLGGSGNDEAFTSSVFPTGVTGDPDSNLESVANDLTYPPTPPSDGTIPRTYLTAWWRADDIAQGDGTDVTNWTDRVAGWVLTEATTKPVYRTAGVGGQPSVQFTRANSDQLSVSTPPLFDAALGCTVFLVLKDTTTNVDQIPFHVNNNGTTVGNSRLGIQQYGATGGVARVYARRLDADGLTSATGGTATNTNAHVMRLSYDWETATGTLYRDGVSQVSLTNLTSKGATSATASFILRIGGYNSGTEFHYDGHIAEIIIYEGTLNATQIGIVESYLNSRYGIGSTPKTDSDTAAGSDAATVLDRAGVADTAAASDAVTARSITDADTATATDAVTVLDQGTVAKTDSDTATATDTVTAHAVTHADTGTATDTVTARAAETPDTAAATDTVTARSITSSDTGTATDAGTLAAAATAADTAAATDAVTAHAVTSTDSGTATDAVQTLDQGTVSKTDSDTASAVDAVIARGVRGADDAFVLEAVITRLLTSSDTAAATDAVKLGSWVKMWDGSAWVGGTLYRWDGSAWV